MYRIEIPAKLWAACGAAVSTEASRPILNGIQLQRHDTHGVACATDGHALVAGRFALENDGTRDMVWPDAEIILPFVKLSALGVSAKQADRAVVVCTSDETRHTWQVTALEAGKYGGLQETGRSVSVREIEGPFPNWRQVVPRGDMAPVTTFALDTAVLEKATALFGKCTYAAYGPDRAFLVQPHAESAFPCQAFGLIMPVLVRESPVGLPAWVTC